MRLTRAVLFLVLAAAAGSAAASDLDFNLASNAVGADFSSNLTDTGLEWTAGFVHHKDRADVGDVGIDLVGNASPVGAPLVFGIGGKFFYIAPNGSSNGEALGVGGHFRYTWPYFNRFAIGGELYYAPNIVSFQNVDRFMEARVTANYQVLRNADAYVGYRYMTAAVSGGPNVTLDSSIIVGMSLSF